VSRVLPGMQAAFVDVGLERTAFLHVDDIAAAHVLLDAQRGRRRRPQAGGARARVTSPDIRLLVNAGDDIVVQVLKDPIGGKGARLTTFISLPSRLLVYMPRGKGLGVSARIESEAERTRLRDARRDRARGPSGRLHRAHRRRGRDGRAARRGPRLSRAALGARARGLAAREPGPARPRGPPLPPACCATSSHAPCARAGRRRAEHARMLQFARDFIPDAESRIELYAGARPIFDLHAVEEDINRALERKVTLKSGGTW
jgi:ribonuclease G